MEETTNAHAIVEIGAALENQPRLVVMRSPHAPRVGKSVALPERVMVLGRAADCDLRLDDAGTSRRHASILPTPVGYEIQDLGSTNGTYLNGRRVKRSVLREGDRIQVGSLTVLRFTCEAGQAYDGLGRALATAGIGLFEWSVAHARVVGSDNLEEIIGLPLGMLSGSTEGLLKLLAPASRQIARDGFAELAQRDHAELDLEVLARGGTRWVGLQAEVLRDEDGSPLFVVGTAVDLTARRRSEAELRRQTQIFDSLYDAVVLSDTEGRITDWSDKAERTFGLSRGQAIGRIIGELGAPCEGASVATAAILDTVGKSDRWTGELALEGGRVVLEAVTVPLRDADGRRAAHLSAFRDVTERKRMEARLLLADRMASVGTLAAGVAHEINNPLAFIRANLTYLADELSPLLPQLPPDVGEELKHVLDETQEGAHRIEVVVRDLKTFSRAEDRPEVEAVNLRSTIGFALKMVENQVRHRAQLDFDVAAGLWVRGNEARLGQVFVNLLVNAAQAIPDGDARHHAIRVRARAADGSVTVEVEDTGSGIAPEVRARLFSPFFTTKRVGEGTGLGLSVSHAIVTALGGDIGVDSQPGRGSVFRVRLPEAPDPAVRALTPTPMTAARPRSRGRVLVVDDDRLVASAIRRVLSSRHEVTIASSGADALKVLAEGEFDAVLCDVMMPDVSGMDLHAHLQGNRPELLPKLAFVTGGAFTPRAQAFVDAVRCPVIRKPFVSADLLALVQRLIDADGRVNPLAETLRSA